CVWSETRGQAVEGMAQALEGFHIEGVGQNLPFLAAVMDQDRFREGRLTTGYIAEEVKGGFPGLSPPPRQLGILTAPAVYMHQRLVDRAWKGPGARRRGRDEWVVLVGREARAVRVFAAPAGLGIEHPDGRMLELETVDWAPGRPLFHAVL